MLKQLQVECLSEAEILLRAKKEQKFRPKISANPRLVEEAETIEKEGIFELASYCHMRIRQRRAHKFFEGKGASRIFTSKNTTFQESEQ